MQINKCFIIFAFENQLALYGLAGLADEFCERGNSLKTYVIRTFTNVDLLTSNLVNLKLSTEDFATNVRVGDFYLKSLTLMLYTYYVCGY